MPLYMDIHSVPGVKSKDVAEAHRKDLIHQHEYGCKCMTYWIDEERETIFCLIDAANKDAVKEMLRKAFDKPELRKLFDLRRKNRKSQ